MVQRFHYCHWNNCFYRENRHFESCIHRIEKTMNWFFATSDSMFLWLLRVLLAHQYLRPKAIRNCKYFCRSSHLSTWFLINAWAPSSPKCICYKSLVYLVDIPVDLLDLIPLFLASRSIVKPWSCCDEQQVYKSELFQFPYWTKAPTTQWG